MTLFCVGICRIEETMVNKFPYDVPEEYASKPLLKGRAIVEMRVRLKGRPNGNGNGKYNTLKIVVDGYNAPVTAGNFIDLVERRFYDGMEIQKGEVLKPLKFLDIGSSLVLPFMMKVFNQCMMMDSLM